MKIVKWAKIESVFERCFQKLKNYSDENINLILKDANIKFVSRTIETAKKMDYTIEEYTLLGEVFDTIDSLVIEDLPTWVPEVLYKFYIVVKNEPRKIKAVWGYFENNYLTICWELISGKCMSSKFFIDFENNQYGIIKNYLNDKSIGIYNNAGIYFLKFVLNFALLMESQKTPLSIKEEFCKCSPSVYGIKMTKIKKSVSLKTEAIEAIKN